MGKKFTEFDVCKAFKHRYKDKVIKYLDELYNMKSEFNHIQDLGLRKQAICDKVQLDPKDPEVKKILENKNAEVQNLAFHYQSYFKNNNTFQQVLTDQHLFWNFQRLLGKPIDSEDEDELIDKYQKRSKLSEECAKINNRISSGLAELYKDDETMKEFAGDTIRATQSHEEWLKSSKDVQAD